MVTPRTKLQERLKKNREDIVRLPPWARGAISGQPYDPAHLAGIHDRAHLYNAAFPDRPPLSYGNGWITGTWCIGACYKNPNPLYGSYPYGYLARVHSLFPDARNILHAFSGGLTAEAALLAVKLLPSDGSGERRTPKVTLVDIHGPEQGRYPTWQGDVTAMPEGWAGRFDLIMSDPPYSANDAEKYDCPPPNRKKIIHALRRVCKPNGNLVWLDVQWPQHQKAQWKTWGHIGLVRSTNHRMRLVSLFRAV